MAVNSLLAIGWLPHEHLSESDESVKHYYDYCRSTDPSFTG